MRLKTWHCLTFLTLAVLIAYYPALHAGYNSVDDLKMISSIEQSGPLDLFGLFFPDGAYYYRPLTILTYILDRDAWGSVASFMHLENILLHLISVILVFTVIRRLLPLWGEQKQWPALFGGLFFALHPLATESVAWISGRTDLLMTIFLLLAVWLTLMSLQGPRFAPALAAAVALFLAALAKEVAVFILPGLLWLIAVYPGPVSWRARLRSRCGPLLLSISGVAGYFILRHLAIARDSGVGTALQGVTGGDYDLFNKGRVAFKVYGFYFKKLFFPWPLNFGIIEISGWYVLTGLLLAGVIIFLLWRVDVAGAFGLMAFCVLSPALLVVFGKMTWTPLAERYLYAPVALFAPLAAFLILRLRSLTSSTIRSGCDLAVVMLLLVFFATTLHRSWIWQDNLRLYQDTVNKSPDFSPAKTELASALIRKGREAEAQAILAEMHSTGSESDYINDDMNLAGLLLEKGDLDGARHILIPLLEKNPKKRHEVLQYLLRVNDQRIGHTAVPEEISAIRQESLTWLEEQLRLRPSAFTRYRVAKLQLDMGDEVSALESFKSSLVNTPADAHYRSAAETFIKKLEGRL